MIGAGLRAEDGHSLGAAQRTMLRIGRAETRGLDPARWRWTPPCPGSTAPLAIATGRQIDALSLLGGLRLEDGEGRAYPIALRAQGTTIIAMPAAPWPDAVRLAVAPWLEDVCGNRPDEGFERTAPQAAGEAARAPGCGDAPVGEGPAYPSTFLSHASITGVAG